MSERCFSRHHAEVLLTPDSPLSDAARRVLRAMLEAGSIGPQRAIKQAALAGRSGVPAREIQEVNLELLAEGICVCTSCGGSQSAIGNPKSKIQNPKSAPMGQYIAETIEQAEPYAEQLHGRGVLCLQHASRLRSAARIGAGIVASEHQGDGTLWGRGTSHLNAAHKTDAANASRAVAEASP